MIQRCTFNKTHYDGMNGNTGCPAGFDSIASQLQAMQTNYTVQ